MDAFKIEIQVDEDEIYWRRRKEDEELEWTPNSTHLISQLTQCFSEYICLSWSHSVFLDFCISFQYVN